jgi:hypothetical protein
VRVERGGVKGFFAREVYRIEAEPGGALGPGVRPEVEALVRRIDAAAQSAATEAGRDEGVGRALGQVDAAEEEFGELLRRELDARGLRSWSGPARDGGSGGPAEAPGPRRPTATSPTLSPRGAPGAVPTPPSDTIDLRDVHRSTPGPEVGPAVRAADRAAVGDAGRVSAGDAGRGSAPALVPVGPAAGGQAPGLVIPVERNVSEPARPAAPAPQVEPPSRPAPVAAVAAPAPPVAPVAAVAAPAPPVAAPPAPPVAPVAAVAAPAAPSVAPVAAVAAPAPSVAPAPGAPVPASPVVPGPPPPIGPPPGPAVRWSVDRLAHLGLPFAVVQRTVGLRPDDDLAWVSTLAEAFVPFVSGDVEGPAVFAGPRADRVAGGLGVPCVVPPDLPPYAGSVGLRTQDDGAGRAWLGRVRGDRSLHVVVGGRGWELFLTKEPDALALAGIGRIVTALQAAVEHGVPVSYLADGGVTRRATALDLAIAVRSLVARS